MTMVAAPPRVAPVSGLRAAPLILGLTILAGTAIDETRLPFATVLQTLANHLWGASFPVDGIETGIIWSYRLPRAIVAACCGAGLALTGVVLQALLRNPLADPYLMGLSAGASTGAVLVTVAGVGGGVISMSNQIKNVLLCRSHPHTPFGKTHGPFW